MQEETCDQEKEIERKKVKIWGATFLVPLGDVECCPAVQKQVYDVNESIGLVENKHVCVQAGGNMGIWAYYLSEIFQTIYTFEPHPENFMCLARNCPQENIIKFQAGLGEKPESMSMIGKARNAGAHQMSGPGFLQVMRLDDLALTALDLLTLDIEGMELMALKGAKNHIEKYSPVIMLEDKGLSDMYGNKKGDCTKWLSSLGYDLVKEIHRDLIFKRK